MASSGAEQGSSFAFPSSSGISRRNVNPTTPDQGGPPPARRRGLALHPDIDPPPPPPRPAFQILAFAVILFFSALQFLPATHFRDPSDPLRKWIPFGSETASTTSRNLGAQFETSAMLTTNSTDINIIDIVSWVDCLDLRVLAVLVNSTLSSSRVPEKVHFHFLVSESEKEKSSYYKLKVLFPEANLRFIGQTEIQDRTKAAAVGEWLWPSIRELVPVLIPEVYPSLKRFIYISTSTIVKGDVEDLFRHDLGTYALAATEDCSRVLGTSIGLINTIQRTAAKKWVSEKPYDANACAPDLSILLVDAQKLDRHLLEAFLWWNKVLDKEAPSDEMNPSMTLALYEKYLRLSPSWKVVHSEPQTDEEIKVISYDGAMRICPGIKTRQVEPSHSNVWRRYLHPKSQIILEH